MENVWSAVGRLTRDIEVKTFGDNSIAKAGVACNVRVKRNGEWVEEPLFMDVEFWVKNSDYVSTWKKGERVQVIGELKQEKWTDKTTGKDVSRVVCVANTLNRLTNKPKDGGTEDVGNSDDVPF